MFLIKMSFIQIVYGFKTLFCHVQKFSKITYIWKISQDKT